MTLGAAAQKELLPVLRFHLTAPGLGRSRITWPGESESSAVAERVVGEKSQALGAVVRGQRCIN